MCEQNWINYVGDRCHEEIEIQFNLRYYTRCLSVNVSDVARERERERENAFFREFNLF